MPRKFIQRGIRRCGNLFRRELDAAEIYSEGYYMLRKFIQRGIRHRGNLFRGVLDAAEIYLEGPSTG
jgi:hypothetical protein